MEELHALREYKERSKESLRQAVQKLKAYRKQVEDLTQELEESRNEIAELKEQLGDKKVDENIELSLSSSDSSDEEDKYDSSMDVEEESSSKISAKVKPKYVNKRLEHLSKVKIRSPARYIQQVINALRGCSDKSVIQAIAKQIGTSSAIEEPEEYIFQALMRELKTGVRRKVHDASSASTNEPEYVAVVQYAQDIARDVYELTWATFQHNGMRLSVALQKMLMNLTHAAIEFMEKSDHNTKLCMFWKVTLCILHTLLCKRVRMRAYTQVLLFDIMKHKPLEAECLFSIVRIWPDVWRLSPGAQLRPRVMQAICYSQTTNTMYQAIESLCSWTTTPPSEMSQLIHETIEALSQTDPFDALQALDLICKWIGVPTQVEKRVQEDELSVSTISILAVVAPYLRDKTSAIQRLINVLENGTYQQQLSAVSALLRNNAGLKQIKLWFKQTKPTAESCPLPLVRQLHQALLR